MDNFEKDYLNKYSEFDKEHKKYRDNVFVFAMEVFEQKFVNMFRFEGDDELTLAKQRLLLKSLFRYGQAGVINSEKILYENMNKTVKKMLDESVNILGVERKELLKLENSSRVVVAIASANIDIDDRMLTGTGITVFRNNTEPRSFNISREDTAFALFNSNFRSGWWVFFVSAYMWAMGETVLKKRIGLLDTKLANNKVNNTLKNVKYEDIYDVNKSFLELSPEMESMANGGTKANSININAMLETKLVKADLNSGETVGEIIDTIIKHRNMWSKELGIRRDNGDGEKGGKDSIQEDYDSNMIHYALMEKEYEDQLSIFCEDYKRIFGKDLKVVNVAKKLQEEKEQKQISLAGHMNDDKIKEKGESNGKTSESKEI